MLILNLITLYSCSYVSSILSGSKISFFSTLLLDEKLTLPFLTESIMAFVGAQIASGKTSVKKLTNWIRGTE